MLAHSGGGRTAAQASRQRASYLRELDISQRAQARTKRQATRTETTRTKMGEQRERCASDALAVREEADATYRAAMLVERDARRAKKAAARQKCHDAKASIREALRVAVEQLTKAADEEKAFRRELRRMPIGKNRKARSAAEKRSESNDEVRQNIPANLLPLWERVQSGIKASDRMTRTEAFLHYVEENPGEGLAAIESEVEREMRALDLQHQRETAPPRPRPKGSAQSRTIGMFGHEDLGLWAQPAASKPATPEPAERRRGPRTFTGARDALLAYLGAHGWTIAAHLKTPHATSPAGTERVYFHPQSVYLDQSRGRGQSFTTGRSMGVDVRELDGPAFVAAVQRWTAPEDTRAPKDARQVFTDGPFMFLPGPPGFWSVKLGGETLGLAFVSGDSVTEARESDDRERIPAEALDAIWRHTKQAGAEIAAAQDFKRKLRQDFAGPLPF